MSILQYLSNEELLDCYDIAIELKLEDSFIQMLLKEIQLRGLTAEKLVE
jgi:hypothetical protein